MASNDTRLSKMGTKQRPQCRGNNPRDITGIFVYQSRKRWTISPMPYKRQMTFVNDDKRLVVEWKKSYNDVVHS